MTILESILLALALSVDSLVVSTTSVLKTKLSYRRGLLLAFTFAVFQGSFPLMGALLGSACEQFISTIDHWVAFGLLALVGGKMIIDAFNNDDENSLDLSNYWVICTLAIATSIDAFVVGIGFGLKSDISQNITTCIIIGVVTFLASLLGVYFGKRSIPIPEKWATIFGGVVLIGLGAKTLLEHILF